MLPRSLIACSALLMAAIVVDAFVPSARTVILPHTQTFPGKISVQQYQTTRSVLSMGMSLPWAHRGRKQQSSVHMSDAAATPEPQKNNFFAQVSRFLYLMTFEMMFFGQYS